MTLETEQEETILVVDDSDDNRRLMSVILRKAGYNVIEAVDGADAIKKTYQHMPDLMLLDIMMPELDGYAVCEHLKADNALKEIPVIFLSALGETKDKIRGLEIGGADYIAKPFDKGEALARIRSHLKIRRLTKDILAANRDLQEKQDRLDEDLRAAAGIQMSLLPKQLPESGAVEAGWQFIPSESIGGDIFNLFFLDENHLGFYILDVSGHGVPSAMVTVSVSQVLQPHGDGILKKLAAGLSSSRILSPCEVLERLDKDYPLERFDKYFTIFYGILALPTGKLLYSSAGHPPAILLRGTGQTEILDKGGTIIGLGAPIPFEMEEKELRRGDKLILYTDGATDCRNGQNESFGWERLLQSVSALHDRPVHDLLGKIVENLTLFRGDILPDDDITFLGITFRGK